MRAAVRGAFPAFTSRFEGRLPFMYLDVLGLVTTGVGNLIDPMAAALALPWLHKLDATPATRPEVVAEWNIVKNAQPMRKLGGGAFARLTTLMLSDAAIDELVQGRLALNESQVRVGYSDWDTFPADAQMAMLSMCWAMGAGRIIPGPAFQYPQFRAAVLNGDWARASDQCKMGEAGNPGLVPRNVTNRKLFLAAASTISPEILCGL